MTAYGFRVFAIKVYKGRSQKAQKLGDVGTEGAHLELKRSLEDIRGDLLFGAARYANAPEDLDEDEFARNSTVAKKHPYVRVFEVTDASGLLSVTAEYGREGDYEILMARNSSESTTLEGQAPGRRYRMWFKMPAVGDTGILVVETRGRTHPGEVLIHWLRVLNQRAAVSFPHDQRKEEEWDRWDTTAATDLARLNDIWAKTANHKITLRQHSVGADNNRTDNPLRLTADALPVSKLDDVKAIVGGWWKNRAKGDKPEARHKAAQKLGALILPKKVLNELSFDDGEVSFEENGKVQTLSPQKIDRLWVYPLGESYPQEDQILDAARPVVDRIAKALKIEVSI